MASVDIAIIPCAYCRGTPFPEQVAAGPWMWPGRGLVVNCKPCAGIEWCAWGHEWDAGEWEDPPQVCPECAEIRGTFEPPSTVED